MQSYYIILSNKCSVVRKNNVNGQVQIIKTLYRNSSEYKFKKFGRTRDNPPPNSVKVSLYNSMFENVRWEFWKLFSLCLRIRMNPSIRSEQNLNAETWEKQDSHPRVWSSPISFINGRNFQGHQNRLQTGDFTASHLPNSCYCSQALHVDFYGQVLAWGDHSTPWPVLSFAS